MFFIVTKTLNIYLFYPLYHFYHIFLFILSLYYTISHIFFLLFINYSLLLSSLFSVVISLLQEWTLAALRELGKWYHVSSHDRSLTSRVQKYLATSFNFIFLICFFMNNRGLGIVRIIYIYSYILQRFLFSFFNVTSSHHLMHNLLFVFILFSLIFWFIYLN